MKRQILALMFALCAVGTVHAQSWDDLSPDNRATLKSLRPTWEELPPTQRQQWLDRAPQLRQLNPSQLANAQERMAEWASLSQKQRGLVQRRLENDGANNPNTRAKSWNNFISQ